MLRLAEHFLSLFCALTALTSPDIHSNHNKTQLVAGSSDYFPAFMIIFRRNYFFIGT